MVLLCLPFVVIFSVIFLVEAVTGTLPKATYSSSSDVKFFPTPLQVANQDLKDDGEMFDSYRANGDLDGMAKEADKMQKDRERIQLLKDDGAK